MKKQRILSILLTAALLFTNADMTLYVRAEENSSQEETAVPGTTPEAAQSSEPTSAPIPTYTPETSQAPDETAVPEESTTPEPTASPEETTTPEAAPSPEETAIPEATETPEGFLPTASPSEIPSDDLDYVLGRPMTEAEVEEQEAMVPNLPLMPKEEPVERYDSGLSFYAAMDEKYDSRDYGYITSVKNQNPWGSCWTYAAIASLESSLISSEVADSSLDLSEWHLAYFSTHTGSDELGNTEGDYVKDADSTTAYMNNGGNINMCIVALSNWKGAAQETDYPGTSDSSQMEENTLSMTPDDAWENNAYQLENCYITPVEDRDSVKGMIQEFGAVFSSYYHSDSCYNWGTAAYYYNENSYTNHAITLVGWDDNYKKENFVSEPEGDGAWICKNSWGSNFGDRGYIYISYYDTSLSASNAAALEGKPVEEKLNNYYYGGGVAIGSYVYTTGIAQCFEAKANASGAEQIEKVGFYTYSADVPYQIQVYKNPDNVNGVVTNPETGEALLTGPLSGTTSFAGYHTIELPQGIYIDEGDVFSVVISFEKTVKIPMDTTSSMQAQYSLLYDSVNITKDGESFLRPESYPWYTDANRNTNSGYTPRMNVITRDISSNKLSEPLVNPQEGTFVRGEEEVTIDKGATVVLSAENGADIYYTTDGNVPIVGVEGTLLYESPITIDKDMTIKAMSVKEGYRNSNVSEESYVACENELSLSKDEIEMIEGENTELSLLKIPTGKTAEDIVWTSSDDTIATYADGVVNAAIGKKGTAIITATVSDHKGSTVTASCTVTVNRYPLRVSYYNSQSEEHVDKGYSSFDKAIAGLSSDFGNAKGEYSFILEADCVLSKDAAIPAFATSVLLQTMQSSEEGTGCYTLDLNGHSITFASNTVTVFEGVQIKNLASETSRITLSTKDSSFWYLTRGSHSFVDASGNPVTLGSDRTVFSNINLNAPDSNVYLHIDSNSVLENPEGLSYTFGGDISAHCLNVSGNTWKTGKVTAAILELQNEAYAYPSNTYSKVDTSLECSDLILNSGLASVRAGTGLTVAKELTLNNATVCVEKSGDAVSRLKAGTINVKTPYTDGPSVANYGILSADKLIVSGGSILNIGKAYIRDVEKVKDMTLTADSIFVCDSLNQISGGTVELSNGSFLVVNDTAVLQTLDVRKLYVNDTVSSDDAAYIYAGKESAASLQNVIIENDDVKLKYGRLDSETGAVIDDDGDLANSVGKLTKGEQGYPVCAMGARSLLFTTGNKAFPVETITLMQKDPLSKYQRVYQLGQSVYVGGDWITIKAQNADGSDTNARTLKSFIKWTDASDYLTTLSNSEMTYIVEISENVDTQEALTLPAKAAKVIFRGTQTEEDERINFSFVGDIKMPLDVTFENIDLSAEVYDKNSNMYVKDVKSAVLNGNTLELINSNAEFTTVTGAAGSKFCVVGTDSDESTLKVNGGLSVEELSLRHAVIDVKGAVTVKETLSMESAEIDSNGKITLKNVVSRDDRNKLSYADNGKNILTISGNISADAGYYGDVEINSDGAVVNDGSGIAKIRAAAIDISVKSLEGNYSQNVVLLNAEKAMSSWFVVGSIYSSENGNRTGIAHLAHKDGKAIKCNAVAQQAVILESYDYSAGEDGDFIYNGGFGTLQEALNEIDRLADGQGRYIVTITTDQTETPVTDIAKTLTFPTKAAEVTITGQTGQIEDKVTLSYKGGLTLKCNVILQNLTLNPNAAKAPITLGNYCLCIVDCKLVEGKTIGKISGSGIAKDSKLVIASPELKSIDGEVSNIAELSLADCGLTVKGKVTVGELQIDAYTLEAEDAVTIQNLVNEEGNGKLIAPAAVTRNRDGEITKIVPKMTINGEIKSMTDPAARFTIGLTEKIQSEFVSIDFTEISDDSIFSGIQLAKAQNVSTDTVAADSDNVSDLQGIIAKKSGYLVFYPDAEYGAKLVYQSEGETITTYCLNLTDAVEEINSLKTKRDYTVYLTGYATNADAPLAFKMPNKNMAQTLTITGEADSVAEIFYTGGLSFSSDTELGNVSFIQMTKSGSAYMDAAETEYPKPVKMSTGGFVLTVKGEVNFNTPIELDGAGKGTFVLAESGVITTTYEGIANEMFGKITKFSDVKINVPKFTISRYETKADVYDGGDLQTTKLGIRNGTSLAIENNATVKDMMIEHGQMTVGGKGEFTDVMMSGNYAGIMVDKDFNIAGTLTSTTKEAHLGTRRKLDKDMKKCIPYLNVKGNVLLGDVNADRIYVGVYPNLSDESVNAEEMVLLEGAPDVTAQLLTASKADVRSFRAEPENVLSVNEFSATDINGYILSRDKDKILVYYAENVEVALCSGNAADGKLETAGVLNYYTSLKEAVSAIKEIKDKGAEYTILLLQDVGSASAPVSLELPAETAKLHIRSVTLPGAEQSVRRSIYYTNNITLKSDTEFENVDLAPVKTAKSGTQGAQLGISTGAYDLQIRDVSVGMAAGIDQTAISMDIKDISGKGELVLDSQDLKIAGNVKDFKNVMILKNATVEGALTVSEVTFAHAELIVKKAVAVTDIANDDGTLIYNKDAGHVTNMTIKGSIDNVDGPLNLVLQLAENETRENQELTVNGAKITLDKTKKLANIEKIPLSDFTMKIVKNDTEETGVNENLVKAEKAVYLVNDATDDNTVLLESSETEDRTIFLDLTQAVKEINTLNHKNAEYRLSVLETGISDTDVTDTRAVSSLKLPDAGKAQSVTIDGRAADDTVKRLECQGAISYKGNLGLEGLVIDAESVTANKLSLIDAKLTTLKNSTLTDLVLVGNSCWDMLNTVSVTSIDVSSATLEGDEEKLSYLAVKQDKNGKPLLTIKGAVAGKNVLCKLIAGESTNADNIVYLSEYRDQNLVIAPVEAAEKFVAFPFRELAVKAAGAETIEGISALSWSAYKDRNNYVKNGNLAEMTVEITDGNGLKTYAKTFEEAVTIIDNIKDTRAEYTMMLLDRQTDETNIVKTGKGGTYGSMKLPSKAKEVTIKGENQPTIMFTGELKPNCDVVFKNVLLSDGKTDKGMFLDSKSIALNMGSFNVTFAQNAGTERTNNDELLLVCTRVSGKGALALNGQKLIGKNVGVDVNELWLKNGASVQAAKDIKAVNLRAEGTAPVNLDTPAALKLTNISGSGELWIHSYYTKKEFAKAATQLTIDGDIREDGSGLKVKIIPYICRDIKLGSYTEANADDISALTITGGKPSGFQKLANMPKAATENIEIYYSAENTLKKAEETVYKYEKGLYLTNQEMAVQVYGENTDSGDHKAYLAEFCSFEDAVKEIDNRADKNMDYELRLLKDLGLEGSTLKPVNALKLPSKAKSVKIMPAEGTASGNTIVFTGKLSLGCNTTVEKVCLAAVKQYKSGNYTYYGTTMFDLNVGGNIFKEIDVLQYVPVSGITGYYSTNLTRVIGTLSGTSKGCYYCVNSNDSGAGRVWTASKITGIGTVEFVNSLTENNLTYIVSGGISGVNEMIVNENVSVEATDGAVTVNNLVIDPQSAVIAKNLTCNKTLTLNAGTICVGSDVIGDGKISLNNVVLNNSGNLLQGRQDKNGKSLIEIKGIVTADAESSFTREAAITVALEYNDGSTYAQLHEGIVMMTAQKVSPYWFIPAYSGEDFPAMGTYHTDFGLLKSGKEIIYGRSTQEAAEVALISNPGTDDKQITYFKTFEEAVKEIDTLALYKDGTKEYADFVIRLRTDVEIGNQKKDGKYNSLTLPAKAGKLTIDGQGHELRFSGNISLKSNLVLQDIAVCPVKLTGKNVVPSKINWTLGKFSLTLDNVISVDAEGNTLVGTISGSASQATLNLLSSEVTEEERYAFAADQITGIKTITLSPYTNLMINKNLTVYNLDFLTQTDREGQEPEAAEVRVRVAGKLTATLIHKNGIGDAVIIKPVKGEIVINGAEIDTDNDKVKEQYSVCFEDGLTPAQQKLTMELEAENYSAGTKVLSCRFANPNHYQVLVATNSSQNEYGTYVSGTTLLLGTVFG